MVRGEVDVAGQDDEVIVRQAVALGEQLGTWNDGSLRLCYFDSHIR